MCACYFSLTNTTSKIFKQMSIIPYMTRDDTSRQGFSISKKKKKTKFV